MKPGWWLGVIASTMVAAAACTAATSASPTASPSDVVMINGTPIPRSDVGGLATPSPATVIVPNVLGMKWNAARREILSSGLRVQYQVVTGDYTTGVVTQQRPKGGASVTPDIVVQMVIGPT